MSGKFFLDTNIFTYSLEASLITKASKARQLIRAAMATRQGIVSYQVVQEFFNVALRRFAASMSYAEAESYFSTVFRPLWAVHSSPVVFLRALQLTSRDRLSWYDSLIIAAAIEAQCEVLYSEDLQHGRKLEGLLIENPFR